MTRRDFARALTAGLGMWQLASPALASDDAMDRYMERVLSDLRRFRRERLATTDRAGDAIAERISSGGTLLVTDARGGYVAEALGRAGGLMAIARLTEGTPVAAGDALIAVADEPSPEPTITLASGAKTAGALVVGICPIRARERALSSHCDIALENYVTDRDAAVHVAGFDGPMAPTSGVLNTGILWALTAAYIEAMERRGKPPHIWKSIKRPGAREFNEIALEETKRVGY